MLRGRRPKRTVSSSSEEEEVLLAPPRSGSTALWFVLMGFRFGWLQLDCNRLEMEESIGPVLNLECFEIETVLVDIDLLRSCGVFGDADVTNRA